MKKKVYKAYNKESSTRFVLAKSIAEAELICIENGFYPTNIAFIDIPVLMKEDGIDQ